MSIFCVEEQYMLFDSSCGFWVEHFFFFFFNRSSFSFSDASKFLGFQCNWYFTLGKEKPNALASITIAVGSYEDLQYYFSKKWQVLIWFCVNRFKSRPMLVILYHNKASVAAVKNACPYSLRPERNACIWKVVKFHTLSILQNPKELSPEYSVNSPFHTKIKDLKDMAS